MQDETPKSGAGQRDIALDQRAVATLRAHLARQAADRLAWGAAWAGSGLVFTREDGSPLHPGSVSNRFRRLAFEAGLPPVSLHSLRHGAATYALAAGVDVKVVQERLGHSTSTLTRDTYTSVLPDVARAAAEAAAAIIPRAESGTGGLPMDSKASRQVTCGRWQARICRSDGLERVGRLGLEPRTHGLKEDRSAALSARPAPMSRPDCTEAPPALVPRVVPQHPGGTRQARHSLSPKDGLASRWRGPAPSVRRGFICDRMPNARDSRVLRQRWSTSPNRSGWHPGRSWEWPDADHPVLAHAAGSHCGPD
ncbi:MAG: tyrosine-type recombinase/integrase [Streptosporangiaceae bacterium]